MQLREYLRNRKVTQMRKRISSVLLIIGICLSATACSSIRLFSNIMDYITDNDNPLSGKNTDDFSYYAKMVYDILNLADTPTIIDPDTEFSTGEVNYYSRPCMGTVLCDIVYDTSKSSLRISFEEKDLSEEQIKTKFEEKYQWLKETQK